MTESKAFYVLDIKTYNISMLTINPPVEKKGGYYISDILYNKLNFKFQSPLFKIVKIDLKADKPYMLAKFKLANNFEYYQFFSGIFELCIEHLMKFYGHPRMSILKNTDGTEDDVRKNFKTNTDKISDAEMCFKIKLNKQTLFFDSKKQEISGLELKQGDKIVCILKTKGLVSDNNTASQMWTASQVLRYSDIGQ